MAKMHTTTDTVQERSDSIRFFENRTFKLSSVTGFLAITAGGLLSAFFAHDPLKLTMWVSAYMVLVVGVLGICFGVCLAMATPRTRKCFGCGAYSIYQLGNILVVAGTVLKYIYGDSLHLVGIGGAVLLFSMYLMVTMINPKQRSRQFLALFYGAVCIVSMGTLIGIGLSTGYVPRDIF